MSASKTRRWVPFLAGAPEALAEGAMTFPVYVFTALFHRRYGEMAFVLPFVLWYSSHRAGVFFLDCLGSVRNPYRLCVLGLAAALSGCLFLLLGSSTPLCWDAGAVLIGLGLSGFAATFRTTRDEMQDQGLADFGGSMVSGYAVFLGAIVALPLLAPNDMSLQAAFLGALVTLSLLLMALLRRQTPYGSPTVFEHAGTWRESLPNALSILLLTFFVRLYRQTAETWVVALMPAAFVLLLWIGRRYRKAPYRAHSMRTLWYGAMTNFLYVFTLFYFTSVGATSRLGTIYFVIGAGTVAAIPMSAGMRRLVPKERYEELCIVGAVVASCLMLLPRMYLPGTLLTSAFVTMGNTESFQSYLCDERIAREERRLVRAKFSSLGSVIEQLQMLLAIILCSALVTGDASSGVAGYALREVGAWNEPVYRRALLACVALNGLTGLLVLAQGRIAESRRAPSTTACQG